MDIDSQCILSLFYLKTFDLKSTNYILLKSPTGTDLFSYSTSQNILQRYKPFGMPLNKNGIFLHNILIIIYLSKFDLKSFYLARTIN